MTTAAGARSSSATDGTTTVFTATFRAITAAEIGVALVNTTTGAVTAQVLNTHYTVALDATTGVPTITFLSAPAAGSNVIIYPTAATKQEEDLDPDSALYGSSIEAALDALAARMQTLEDKVGQCIRVSQADAALSALGDGATRASTVLTFNSTGGIVLEARSAFAST